MFALRSAPTLRLHDKTHYEPYYIAELSFQNLAGSCLSPTQNPPRFTLTYRTREIKLLGMAFEAFPNLSERPFLSHRVLPCCLLPSYSMTRYSWDRQHGLSSSVPPVPSSWNPLVHSGIYFTEMDGRPSASQALGTQERAKSSTSHLLEFVF